MNRGKSEAADETISVADMNRLVSKEIRTVTKAADLRLRELTDLAASYAEGKLTPEQATDGYYKHADKWGEALPGVVRPVETLSDAEIHAEIEKAAGPYTSRRESEKRYQASFGNKGRTNS